MSFRAPCLVLILVSATACGDEGGPAADRVEADASEWAADGAQDVVVSQDVGSADLAATQIVDSEAREAKGRQDWRRTSVGRVLRSFS